MHYTRAVVEKRREELSFRMYVTDALKTISESNANYGGGSYLNTRWIDIIIEPKEIVQDDRPCVEIAADIFKRIRGGEK